MKRLVWLLLLFVFLAVPAWAAQYEIVLLDGTRIEVDSYRGENGKIYYPGSYGIEAFVDKKQVRTVLKDGECVGKPIILIFNNARVLDIINLIAEYEGINIMIGSEVDKTKTVSTHYNEVPSIKALYDIAIAANLRIEKRGDAYIVMNP